jgi:hypothetical protein
MSKMEFFVCVSFDESKLLYSVGPEVETIYKAGLTSTVVEIEP